MSIESDIREIYGLTPDIDVSNTVSLSFISLEKFYINIDNTIKPLSEHLIPTSEFTKKETVLDFRLRDVNTPLKIDISVSIVVGKIYYDKQFVPDALIGYFNGCQTFSSIPKLVNPKIVSELYVNLSRPVGDPRRNPYNLINYILGAKTRSEDLSYTEESFFNFNGIDINKPFYDYLQTIRVRDFKK